MKEFSWRKVKLTWKNGTKNKMKWELKQRNLKKAINNTKDQIPILTDEGRKEYLKNKTINHIIGYVDSIDLNKKIALIKILNRKKKDYSKCEYIGLGYHGHFSSQEPRSFLPSEIKFAYFNDKNKDFYN